MAELLAMADDETSSLWQDLKLGYTESPGHPLLRQEIAALYKNFAPEDTLVMVPEEGIFLLMNALLEPGDHVVCTFPGYQSLYEIAHAIGCQVSLWKPDENSGWAFDLDDLSRMMQPTTKLVVVNFPHNPTGHLPDRQAFNSIVSLAERSGVYLLSDEMYRFLEIDPASRLPPACEYYERAISLSGLSKAYGLPGLRLGWLATKTREVLARVIALKDYTTICSSAPGEILGVIGLRNKVKILEEQRARLLRNLTDLTEFIDAKPAQFQMFRPAGGSVCFPRLVEVEDTDAFCEELVREAGIMLLPSSLFQFGRQHVRIGFGREDFPQVLERFAGYLDEQQSRA